MTDPIIYKKMYYCFLEDSSFYPNTNVDLGNIELPESGILGSNEEAYLVKKATIKDPRNHRLQFNNNDMTGNLKLYFDQSKVPAKNEYGYDIKDLFANISQENLVYLFNILERIYMNCHEDLSLIEDALENDKEYYSDCYYPGSLSVSKKYSHTETNPDTGEQILKYNLVTTDVISHQGENEFSIRTPNYFTFIFVDKTNDDKTDLAYEIKVWLNRRSFLDNYPLSTIIKVILPCDYNYILDPSKFVGSIDALVKSSDFSFNSIDVRDYELGDDIPDIIDISTLDTSGLITFKTRYVISSQATQQLPFGVLFKGAKPSTMEIRKAIREYLIDISGISENKWEAILPDLFVTGQFFLVPMWNNVTARVANESMYPSIINYKSMNNIFTTLFPDLSTTFINKYQEILTNGQSEIFITSLPDELNDDNVYSIYELHPTYQHHTAQEPAYAYQEDKTKAFNKSLNRCLSALMGESVIDGELNSTNIDGVRYISFTASRIEYHVMKKSSYIELFGDH